ncbi:MAG: HlyD family efflux transporter periplasmic adaptor subunit [Clostridiales bacterium]|nr:HlyD family efflux transporter periplasmic adaptor subunit [Clostridiales bacterium]
MTIKKKKKLSRLIRKLLIWIILLAVAAAAIRIFVLPRLEASATITYNSYTARTGTISNSLSFSGSIQVQNNETISSPSSATVRQIYVSEGEKVTRDQRLMRLSNGSTLKASFAGEVNQINVEVGDEVGANASLIQIVDFENMQVSMRVDEYSISALQVGQACRISITALNETFDSRIAHINRIPSGGGNTAYYTVTAELQVASDVLPGMAATVTIPQQEAVDSIILNKDALSFGRDNSAYVLMYDENQVLQQVPVTVGLDNDNYVEITSGLKDGDTVYAQVTTTAGSGGLFSSLFSSFGGGGMQNNRQNRQNNSNFGGGRMNMPGGYGGR